MGLLRTECQTYFRRSIRRPRYGYDFARFTAGGRNWNDTNRDKQPVRPQSNEQRNYGRPAKAGCPWKGKTAHEKGGSGEARGSVVGNVEMRGQSRSAAAKVAMPLNTFNTLVRTPPCLLALVAHLGGVVLLRLYLVYFY